MRSCEVIGGHGDGGAEATIRAHLHGNSGEKEEVELEQADHNLVILVHRCGGPFSRRSIGDLIR